MQLTGTPAQAGADRESAAAQASSLPAPGEILEATHTRGCGRGFAFARGAGGAAAGTGQRSNGALDDAQNGRQQRDAVAPGAYSLPRLQKSRGPCNNRGGACHRSQPCHTQLLKVARVPSAINASMTPTTPTHAPLMLMLGWWWWCCCRLSIRKRFFDRDRVGVSTCSSAFCSCAVSYLHGHAPTTERPKRCLV